MAKRVSVNIRQDGFYWVKADSDSEPQVAEWNNADGGYWSYCGSLGTGRDKELFDINEKRLIPDDQKDDNNTSWLTPGVKQAAKLLWDTPVKHVTGGNNRVDAANVIRDASIKAFGEPIRYSKALEILKNHAI